MSVIRGAFDPSLGIVVRVGIAQPYFVASRSMGPIPHIEWVDALLDTGASNTSIKARVADRLDLSPLGRRQTHSIHGLQSTNWYLGDIWLRFDDSPGGQRVASEIQLVELDRNARVEALIGRDVLCRCDFQMTKAHEFVLSL